MTAAPTVLLIAALAQAESAEPKYRYVEVPPVKPGSTLYAYVDEAGAGAVICADVFALAEAEKAILAGDQAGIDELQKARRLFIAPTGTPVKVIEYTEGGVITDNERYEVRVLEGDYKDKKGHAFAQHLRHRVEVKDKPKRKRR